MLIVEGDIDKAMSGITIMKNQPRHDFSVFRPTERGTPAGNGAPTLVGGNPFVDFVGGVIDKHLKVTPGFEQ